MVPQGPRRFTRSELSRHDGDRAPAYVAVGRTVYDVSTSGEWRSGLHRNLHWAGQELAGELIDAPHGIENVLRFPVVGELAEGAEGTGER